MGKIDVNIEDLKKEIKGIIYTYLHKELESINLYDFIEKIILKYVKRTSEKIIEKEVYAYLEESQIIVPNTRDRYGNRQKIALNTYILQKINEFMSNKVREIIDNSVKITFNVEVIEK